MITCPKCNKELSDGSKFCDGCGTKILEKSFCPNCGKETSSEFAFCQFCGAATGAKPMVAQPVSEQPVGEQPAIEQPVGEQPAVQNPYAEPSKARFDFKKFLSKKSVMFGGIGAAVLVIAIFVIALFCGGNSENNYALYVKDGEIFFNDLEGNPSWQLTTKLLDTNEISSEDLAGMGYRYQLAYFTKLSKDGKLIFFPDKLDQSFNLYFKSVDNPQAEAIKIDSEIRTYSVNASATLVTYLKGSEGNLYQYDIRNNTKEKIASDVRNFQTSEDGDKIIFMNAESSIYLKEAGKDKEKIASEVENVEYIADDLSTIYYIKEAALYKHVMGEDKVKIVSDVEDILKIYDSGEIYYLKNVAGQISIMDYVNDDMKELDEVLTEPTYPDYPAEPERPYSWDYENYAAYEAAYQAYEQAYSVWQEEKQRMESEYQTACQAYAAKVSRDELRSELSERTLQRSSFAFYFYNGTEEVLLTDSFNGSSYTYAANEAVISYKAYNQSSFEKVKLSEITSVYDLENMVEAALFSSSERYIAVKGTASLFAQQKEAVDIIINDEGTAIYYVDNLFDETNHGELYTIAITGSEVGKAELYDADVYNGYCEFLNDTDVKYFKDYKEGKGELYINKNRVDFDVKDGAISYDADLDQVLYYVDWNNDKSYGTLKMYDGEEVVKIADEVHDFTVTPDGRVLFLYDFSLNYHKGMLIEWDDGDAKKLDDDVTGILPIL